MPTQIVLAEDNSADVGLVREAFREHGVDCELRVISDGEEAMTFISTLDVDTKLPCPDLFLLDLHLPRRNGEEILRHLRSSERCGRTPVVVLTASDSPHDHLVAGKNAAVHYFLKTSVLSQFMLLGGVVKDVIDRHSRAKD